MYTARKSATTTSRPRSTAASVSPARTTWATCSSSSGTSRTSTGPPATSSSPALSTRTCTHSGPGSSGTRSAFRLSSPRAVGPLEDKHGSPGDEIGGRLREERQRQHLSLRKLADRIGISPSALSQIETGRSRPSVSTLYAIVSELGISFDELFPGGAARDASRPSSSEGGIVVRSLKHDPEQIVTRGSERKVIELASGVVWER